jgi:hypothetical protein
VAFLQGHSQPEQYTVVTNDQDLANRVRAVGARRILASDFAARLALRPPLPSSEPGRPAFDPHDPAFADIYAGFVQADKARARFGGSRQADTAFWIEKLYGDDLDEVQRAARWLGQHGGSYALAPLRDALTHGDARVRAAALLALGDLGDQTVLPDLCARLANDTNSMVREAAAQSLGRIGDRTIEPALEAAARTDAKGKVRKAAQAALAQVRARRKARP